MATIQKRGNKFRVLVRRSSQSITKTFINKKDAEAWGRKTESGVERGLYLDVSEAQNTTLLDVVDRYEAEVMKSKRGYEADRFHLKPIRELLGRVTLATLKPSHISKYRDDRSKVVAGATVIKELGLISRVLNTAVKDWSIPLPQGNVVQQIRKPKAGGGRTRRLENGEEQKLLNALEDTHQVKAIVLLALETAMRRGELANITWQDIDLKARTLHIPVTKTDTPRTIPLSTKAVGVLLGLPRQLSGQVFRIEPHSITQAFERACKRAGIEGLRFHDLRHEATSRLFEKGLSVMEVATITGHKDTRMLSRYTHLRAEDIALKLA